MRWPLTVLVLVLGLVAAACASGETVQPSASSTFPDGDWILVEGVPPVDGFPVTMSIDGTAVGGTAACNGYGGTADMSDGVFRLGEFFVTEMGCEPAVMEAEAAFLAALLDASSWRIEDERLVVSGSGTDLVFERQEPVPTEALVGTEWVLETLVQGEAARTPTGSPATLTLLSDGTIDGSTGCRSLSGTWVVQYGRIFFPEFAADGECPDDLFDQDNLVVTVLGDGFVAEVDGDRLIVTSVGNEGLVYRAG